MFRPDRLFPTSKALIPASWCALFALLCSPSAAPRQPPVPPAPVVEVAQGIFVRAGQPGVAFEAPGIANVGFVIGSRCVAVIDTGGSLAEGEALAAAIREVTDQPVCYVINTHVHPDHLFGNLAFRDSGAVFIGHGKLPRALALRGTVYLQRASAAQGHELTSSYLVFPEQTVSGSVELDIGNRVLTVRAHPTAHTDHDLSVIDEKTRTAFLADLVFVEHVPVIDGSITGWIEELRLLQRESFETVVPGHGPVHAQWPSASVPVLDYLTVLREEIRTWIADNGDLVSAQDTVGRSKASSWVLFDRYHRRNVGAAYAELEWEE